MSWMVKDGVWDRCLADKDLEGVVLPERPTEEEVRAALKAQRTQEGEEFHDCLIGKELIAEKAAKGGTKKAKSGAADSGGTGAGSVPTPRGCKHKKASNCA